MYKSALFLILLSLSVHQGISQNKTEDFVITLPETKVPNSLYNKISFLDSRYDTSHFGIVQLGAFNRKARVLPETPFGKQLSNLLTALTDGSAKDGEILLQLRQFSFAEITGATSEKGYCYMRADLYSKTNDQYQKLGMVDTVILVKAMDVTRALFRRGSKTITDFLAEFITKTPLDQTYYSFNDVQNIDAIEKRKITLYSVATLSDGVYDSYKSFMNQMPDRKAEVVIKNDKIESVKSLSGDGKMEKIKAKDIYAVVHDGKPFIATEYGYYPLQKTGGDFFFTGKAKVNPNVGDVIAAQFFFGIIGGLIASDASSTFEMKLDHINGGFMRLREIKEINN